MTTITTQPTQTLSLGESRTTIRSFFRAVFKSWIAHHQRMADAGHFYAE